MTDTTDHINTTALIPFLKIRVEGDKGRRETIILRTPAHTGEWFEGYEIRNDRDGNGWSYVTARDGSLRSRAVKQEHVIWTQNVVEHPRYRRLVAAGKRTRP